MQLTKLPRWPSGDLLRSSRVPRLLLLVAVFATGANAHAADERAEEAKDEAAQPTPAEAEAKPHTPSNVDARVSTEVAGYQDTVYVSVLTPSVSATVKNVVAGWSANGRYLVDVVSAASPDIVSTASARWSEVRNAGNLGASYKPGLYGGSVTGFVSSTPDYLALSISGRLTQDLLDKNLTLTEGYGYGHDTIGRTGTPFSVFSRKLDYHTLTLGLSRVVNPSTVIGVVGEMTIERGDQSKPYRYVPMFAPGVASTIEAGASVKKVAESRIQARPIEQLPLARERYSISGRLSWRLATSTVRIDERLYLDSWAQHAATTDAKWMFDVGQRVIVWPHLRLHLQDGASFWQRAYTARDAHDLPAFRTGDRELSPLMNVGLGAGGRLALGSQGHLEDWVVTGTFEGTHTSFFDAIYVTSRFSALLALGLEVGF